VLWRAFLPHNTLDTRRLFFTSPHFGKTLIFFVFYGCWPSFFLPTSKRTAFPSSSEEFLHVITCSRKMPLPEKSFQRLIRSLSATEAYPPPLHPKFPFRNGRRGPTATSALNILFLSNGGVILVSRRRVNPGGIFNMS